MRIEIAGSVMYAASAAILLVLMILYFAVEVVLKLVSICQLFDTEKKKKTLYMPIACYVCNLENVLQLSYSIVSISALAGIIHIGYFPCEEYFWLYHCIAAVSSMEVSPCVPHEF